MNRYTSTTSAMLSLVAGLAPVSAAQALPGTQGRGLVAANPTADVGGTMRVAVIGDYGFGGTQEGQVAALVHFWRPDVVMTVGDNNYPDGEATTIDANVGQFYQRYIGSYQGAYGPGAGINRFFPALGNHDWRQPNAQPYLDYFSLPGNERYYDVRRGWMHAFVVDSDVSEPHGVTAGSVQAAWLEAAMAASDARFKFVFLHHAPFSSSDAHGPQIELQWNFADWGAHAVFAGHDHVYERLDVDGIAYFVNGLGGTTNFYGFENNPTAGSRERYVNKHGAILIELDRDLALVRFVTRTGAVADQFRIYAEDPSQGPELLIRRGATWRYHDLGVFPGATWTDLGHDETAWGTGAAHFGYGDGDETTVVSFGPDPGNKYITTYYRHTFTVTDPGAVTELRLDALMDDGAVIHLNGVEIARANLPAGNVVFGTQAVVGLSGNLEDSFFEFDVDPARLVGGANQLAVEIHQSDPTTSDQSFDLALSALRGTSTFIAAGADWTYLDDGVDPGPTWTQLAFDDTAWKVGPAELGYGDGDEATVVDFGPDPANKHITTWLRREFTVADAASWNGLFLRLVRDDGVVVHLNGKEVHRYNLPLLGSTASTRADVAVAGNDESAWFETRIDQERLVDGTNVLAVEVHQSHPTSSDMSFNLELVGRP
jgi:hypothetical protein